MSPMDVFFAGDLPARGAGGRSCSTGCRMEALSNRPQWQTGEGHAGEISRIISFCTPVIWVFPILLLSTFAQYLISSLTYHSRFMRIYAKLNVVTVGSIRPPTTVTEDSQQVRHQHPSSCSNWQCFLVRTKAWARVGGFHQQDEAFH